MVLCGKRECSHLQGLIYDSCFDCKKLRLKVKHWVDKMSNFPVCTIIQNLYSLAGVKEFPVNPANIIISSCIPKEDYGADVVVSTIDKIVFLAIGENFDSATVGYLWCGFEKLKQNVINFRASKVWQTSHLDLDNLIYEEYYGDGPDYESDILFYNSIYFMLGNEFVFKSHIKTNLGEVYVF